MSVVNDIREQQKRKRSYKIGRYKSSWSKGEAKQVYITVTTENGRTLNNSSKHKLLNSYAKRWGEINSRDTIYNDRGITIKLYSCSGHGGYLVITDKPIPDKKASLSVDSYPADFNGMGFYLYEFEEDNGFNQLFVSLPDKIQSEVVSDFTDRLINEKSEAELLKKCQERLNKWNMEQVDIESAIR